VPIRPCPTVIFFIDNNHCCLQEIFNSEKMFRFSNILVKATAVAARVPNAPLPRLVAVTSSMRIPQAAMVVSQFGTYKTTTGLTGLAVDPDGRANLIRYSLKVLQDVKKIPPCGYRRNVEEMFGWFFRVALLNEDVNILFLFMFFYSSLYLFCFYFYRSKQLKMK
jgi:hypothetical protein